MLAPTTSVMVNENHSQLMDESPTRSVGIQTTYRDSESQTMAYTPDYTIPEGEEEPEILSLSMLSSKQGLPAGLKEIEMIERKRDKKLFEMYLPPMTDEASFDLRKKLMEAQEMKEWSYREQEINKLQEERLEVLKQAVFERDQENEYLSEQRVEALRQKRTLDTDAEMKRIQQLRIKNLRKLSKKRNASTVHLENKKTVIDEYANYASTVYVPSTRQGKVNAVEKRTVEGITQNHTQSLTEIHNIEAKLPKKLTAINIAKPMKRETRGRQGTTALQHLEKMAALIERDKLRLLETNTEIKHTAVPSWKKGAGTKIIRPTTPILQTLDRSVDNAVIVLQRLLRGRAVQNSMYEGKERRLDLIRELRESEVPIDEETEEPESKLDASIRQRIKGEIVSAMLDKLAKQALHLQEVQKVNDMMSKAIEERELRETAEMERRVKEEKIRVQRNFVYRQLQAVHEITAHTMVEEMICNTIDTLANDQAKNAKRKSAPYDAIENSQECIQLYLNNYILPEVERLVEAQHVSEEELRFSNAAMSSLKTALESMRYF